MAAAAQNSQDQIAPSRDRKAQGVTFRTWDGGEFGIMDAGEAGRASKQMFTGKNMQLYNTGLLGPRPGLKKITIGSMPTGTLQGMDQSFNTSGTGPWFWVAIGGSFYQVDIGAGTVTAAYAGGAVAGLTRPIPNGGNFQLGTILNLYGKGIYKLDHVAHTVTGLYTSPSTDGVGGGTTIGFYRTRFVANGWDGAGGVGTSQLNYSNAAIDWGTWPAISFYLQGGSPDTMYRPFRDGLIIGKQQGGFFYLTGALGVSVVERLLSTGGAPLSEPRGVVLDGDMVWYNKYAADYLSSFNGAHHTDYQYLPFCGPGNIAADVTVTPGLRLLSTPWTSALDFMAISGGGGAGANRMMQFLNGIFTYNTFGVTTSAWGVGMGQYGVAAANYNTNVVILGDGPGGKYYTYAASLDRPGFTSDTYAQPGDDSTAPLDAYVTTPEWWDDQGHEVRVQQVIVDYVAWNTGSSGNNGFTVQVDMLHRWGDAATTTGTPVTPPNFGAVSGYSTSGDKLRSVTSVDASSGFGGGFQITVANIKGCAIRSITAVLSADSRRP